MYAIPLVQQHCIKFDPSESKLEIWRLIDDTFEIVLLILYQNICCDLAPHFPGMIQMRGLSRFPWGVLKTHPV